MFIIINSEKVFKVQRASVIVGSADLCDLVVREPGVAPTHLKLERGENDSWNLTPLGPFHTTVNRQLVKGKEQIGTSGVIGMGTAVLQLLGPSYKRAISREFDKKTFHLTTEMHRMILDTINKTTSGFPEQQYIDRIEYEMKRLLGTLVLSADFQFHLGIRAIQKMLRNRVQGSNKGTNHADIVSRHFDQYSDVATQIERMIGLDDKESPQEKVERIELLVPWALEKNEAMLSHPSARALANILIRSQLFDAIFGPSEILFGSPELTDVIEQIKKLTPELIAHLRRHEEDLIRVNPRVFEHLIAEFFASWGFEDVRLVGTNPKTSADIYVVKIAKPIGFETRYFVEVKRWKSKVGIEVINQVLGAMIGEREQFGWHAAMIVTVAGFTEFEKWDRQQLKLKGIELKDRDDLLRWLHNYKENANGLWLPEPTTLI